MPKADVESTLVNTRASVRSGNKLSITGIWQCYLFKAALRGFGSMQTRSSPDFFTATTIWLTHSVGSSTGEMTLRLSSLCSSSLNFSRTDKGTFLAGRTTGLESGSTQWRCTFPGSDPRLLLNTSGGYLTIRSLFNSPQHLWNFFVNSQQLHLLSRI